MWRKRVLRVVLVVVGLIFIAGVYPLVTSVRDGWRANKEESLPMGISLYVTQGVFLRLASRNPLANRGERQDLLVASAVFALIGVVLIALAPAKQPVERASGVVA